MKEEFIPGQWKYVCCHCIVNSGTHGVDFTYSCTACDNTNLRFIHTLEHREDGRQIEVGIECARKLMNRSSVPRLAENETKRKERWRVKYRNPGRCISTIADLEDRGKL
jgi:hypothetical protein